MVTKQLHMIPIFVRMLGGLGEPAKISSPEILLISAAEMPTSWSTMKYVTSAIGMLVHLLWIPYYSKYALCLKHCLVITQPPYGHSCQARFPAFGCMQSGRCAQIWGFSGVRVEDTFFNFNDRNTIATEATCCYRVDVSARGEPDMKYT